MAICKYCGEEEPTADIHIICDRCFDLRAEHKLEKMRKQHEEDLKWVDTGGDLE